MSAAKANIEAISEKIFDKVFKIKLKGTQEMPVSQEFLRAVEQEYAIKYLENMNIEPTKSNIAMILKNNPLTNCRFAAGWNQSGLIADSLTIISRQRKPKAKDKASTYAYGDLKKTRKEIEDDNQKKEDKEKLKELEQQRKYAEEMKKLEQKDPSKKKNKFEAKLKAIEDEEEVEDEKKYKFLLDFSIENIKQKYLYPFNESKTKKQYQNLTDDPNLAYLPKNDDPPNEVFNSKKYYFPFSHVKIATHIIKELQTPIKVTSQEISVQAIKYVDSFPFNEIPYDRGNTESEDSGAASVLSGDSKILKAQENIRKNQKLPLLLQGRGKALINTNDIMKTKEILKSEEMTKTIGIILHLSYWQIFGHVVPVQPDLLTRKQMIIAVLDQINKIRKRWGKPRTWALFGMPMVLLQIRMISEFFIRNSYPLFFDDSKSRDIALEKMHLLITNMFDPGMFYSRFTFFESEIQAIKKKHNEHINEAKLISKRIYGTNPYMDIYFPNPESEFVRGMIYRKHSAKEMEQIKDRSLSPKREEEIFNETGEEANKEYLHQSYQVKMFQLLLDKAEDGLPKQFKKRANPLNYTKESS